MFQTWFNLIIFAAVLNVIENDRYNQVNFRCFNRDSKRKP